MSIYEDWRNRNPETRSEAITAVDFVLQEIDTAIGQLTASLVSAVFETDNGSATELPDETTDS
jgi:hypothetical protein